MSKATKVPPAYSFCESATATSISPWCLRKVTPEVGQKFGGGVDTPSFCGRVKVRFGWDLEVPINDQTLQSSPIGRACPTCKPLYRFDLWKRECSDYLMKELSIPDLLAEDDPYDAKVSMQAAFDRGETPKAFIDDMFGEDMARRDYDSEQAAESAANEDDED
jgi:hypothetical protein